MNSAYDADEPTASVSDATKMYRANRRAWQWQRIGLIVGLTSAAIFASLLPNWLAKTEPSFQVSATEVVTNRGELATQLGRLKLAATVDQNLEFEKRRSALKDEVVSAFKQLHTNETGRRIAADESVMLRYQILNERLLKLISLENPISETEIATVLASPNHSADQVERARQFAMDQRQRTLEEIREYQAIASVLAGLMEEAQVHPMNSLTLDQAVGEIDRQSSEVLTATIKRAKASVEKEAADKLRAMNEQLKKLQSDNAKLELKLVAGDRKDKDALDSPGQRKP